MHISAGSEITISLRKISAPSDLIVYILQQNWLHLTSPWGGGDGEVSFLVYKNLYRKRLISKVSGKMNLEIHGHLYFGQIPAKIPLKTIPTSFWNYYYYNLMLLFVKPQGWFSELNINWNFMFVWMCMHLWIDIGIKPDFRCIKIVYCL